MIYEIRENEGCLNPRGEKKYASFRVLKGFNIAAVDSVLKEAFAREKPKNADFFKAIFKIFEHGTVFNIPHVLSPLPFPQVVAKAIGHKTQNHGGGDSSSAPASADIDPIGSTRTFAQRRYSNYKLKR